MKYFSHSFDALEYVVMTFRRENQVRRCVKRKESEAIFFLYKSWWVFVLLVVRSTITYDTTHNLDKKLISTEYVQTIFRLGIAMEKILPHAMNQFWQDPTFQMQKNWLWWTNKKPYIPNPTCVSQHSYLGEKHNCSLALQFRECRGSFSIIPIKCCINFRKLHHRISFSHNWRHL